MVADLLVVLLWDRPVGDLATVFSATADFWQAAAFAVTADCVALVDSEASSPMVDFPS